MDALGTGFDALLVRAALIALALAACWTVLVVLAVAAEAVTAGRVRLSRPTGCPASVRVWLLGAFVTALATMSPAQADPGPHAGPDTPAGAPSAGDLLAGLPLPDRQTGSRSGGQATGAAPIGRTIVVRPGDSLWLIARQRLGPRTGVRTVAASVTALYAANRRLIGPDPDLVRPGQRLTLPDHARRHQLSEER